MTQSGPSYRDARQRSEVRRVEMTLLTTPQARTSARTRLALPDRDFFIDLSAKPDGSNSKVFLILNYEVRLDEYSPQVHGPLVRGD